MNQLLGKDSNVYSAGNTGSDGRYYVSGRGTGFGYDSGMLYPEQRFSSAADAKAAAVCCNKAYEEGRLQAQRDLRAALGLPA